jgi:uncharacterized Fe-S radical SAM superfamily protein PflX
MTKFSRNKAHFRSLSTSAIPLVCNIAQNKVTSDDTESSLDRVDENLSDVESSDSDNEVGEIKNPITKMASCCGWCDVKCQVNIWLLGVPQWHDVHNKYH